MIKQQIIAIALGLCYPSCSFATELDASKQLVGQETSQTENGVKHNIILGSLGLLGVHKPGLKAVFHSDAIYCAEIAVFFNGLSRFYLPSFEYQLPFFKLLEDCAKEKSILSTDDKIQDALKGDLNEFMLVEIQDDLEIALHYLAFLNRSEIKNHPKGAFYTGGIYGSMLTQDRILRYFHDFRQKGSIVYNDNEEELLHRAQEYIVEKQKKEEFPLGASLMTTLEYDKVFCSLKQYKWVRDISKIFRNA